MTQATEPHPALTHRCPFCHADPGEQCRTHRGRGAVRRLHSRRIAATRPSTERASTRVHALCCVCGCSRTVSADYRRSGDPNYSFRAANGWLHTQTLKCAACAQPTRHALLRPAHVAYRDYEERWQRFALGGEWDGGEYSAPDRDRVRAEYFALLPRNPYLRHAYRLDEARRAWAAGQRTVTAACGASMSLHRDPDGPAASTNVEDYIEPETSDEEYEDPDTGLWWVDMECVDCCRVSNDEIAQRDRKLLLTELLEVSTAVDTMTAAQVRELREHLGRLIDPDRQE